jgi:hypothetical protein
MKIADPEKLGRGSTAFEAYKSTHKELFQGGFSS